MLFSYAVILLCSFESYYSLSNSVIYFSDFIMPLRIFFIQFPILLFAFELCYAVFQSYYWTVQSSHVVSNPIISFQILLVTFPILLCHYEFVRPRPHVSADFCIRKFFYAYTPSVHTCPPYRLGVSGDFCIRSPEWKFLYTLCIRIRVDARIRIFLYTLTSQYQNQSFSARDLTNPLRCPDTNRIRVDSRIRFVYAPCGRRYFCIRIKIFADTKISGYVWTGPYSVSNSIIRFRIMFFQIRDFVYLADGALGTSNKLISRVWKTWQTKTSTVYGIDYEHK